ncbi:DUF6259 domain-containing protein, partial [Paenibacillus koleovorans]|uniref:DUF6259 domain-containing protein n=1 Tax=Paenibacillus koleovorans TaxID=121608 RepID=UPI0013E38816
YSTDYPMNMTNSSRSVPFGLMDCKGQGLYVGFHQTTDEQMVQFTFELKPGYGYTDATTFGSWPDESMLDGKPAHMEFSCVHFPFCAPGERYRLEPIVLEPYQGTWQYGADCYKRWRRTWMTDVRPPAWAQGVHSWQQYQINSSEDRMRMSYEDIVQLGEDCVRHGVKVLQITGWNSGGQDRDYPRHDIDPRLGTMEQFQAAIRRVQEMGVKVVLFTKYTWADQSSDWFNEELHKYASRDPYGHYHVISGYRYHTATQMADINTRRGIPLCFNSPELRDIILHEYEKSFELGADGMLYDEFHFHGRMSGDLFYCFSCEHDHRSPANLYAGDHPLGEAFLRIKERRNPEFLLAGEGVRELQYRYMTSSYFRVTRHHFPMQRYIAPEAQMISGIIGFQDRIPINQCLMYRYVMCYEPYHFKGRLDDFKGPLAYGRQVDALRERYSEYLWEAEYRDQLGARVTAEGKPHEVYSVFVNPVTSKRAVVVCNHRADRAIEIDVELEESGGRAFRLVSPEQPEACESEGRCTVAPMSTVVLLEGRPH